MKIINLNISNLNAFVDYFVRILINNNIPYLLIKNIDNYEIHFLNSVLMIKETEYTTNDKLSQILIDITNQVKNESVSVEPRIKKEKYKYPLYNMNKNQYKASKSKNHLIHNKVLKIQKNTRKK